MVVSASAKILVGIPLDANDSHQLLSWAVRVLARANDTIVALHVLETKDTVSKTRNQTRFRRAKAFVISVVGEFAKICHSKQVNLEAKVAFSASIGKGLIDEATVISAEFLVVSGTRKNRSDRASHGIVRYCFKNALEKCAVISVGKHAQPKQASESNSPYFDELHRTSSKHSTQSKDTGISTSSAETHLVPKPRREKPSPRTVLNWSEGESNSTELEDTSSFGCSEESTPLPPKLGGQPHTRKKVSVRKLFSSFFLPSPYDISGTKRKEKPSNEENHQPPLRCFSYADILNATNNFHSDNLVGLGGYSEVYRGDTCDGMAIAVKRLAKGNTEKEFLLELGILGHVCHPNTAKLIGCCIENGLHLIFNFCPNGNLGSALHGRTCDTLEWPIRYKIAVGVARGLNYLHKCCKHRIVHRDIKASNVLLGPDYEPQITDFGLAKWLPNKWTHHAVIPIEGTFGYLAPEYFMHGIVNEKIDVFSFGILLLEIVTGRQPVDSSKQNLLHWAKPLMESGDITQLADPKLGGTYDMEQMQRLILAASYCVRRTSTWRPSMAEVLELVTNGYDFEATWGWGTPKYTDDEMVDFSKTIEEISMEITSDDM